MKPPRGAAISTNAPALRLVWTKPLTDPPGSRLMLTRYSGDPGALDNE